ncbi:RHS repeat-associated core domain-containing protein [Streptomyces sp. NPDC050264]|uniref:RHS repeat-associated core domain-containing protein n=1 Tax=Streptomyces sp. NPDC050264 TaxID=3155038 RepID=UPI003438D5B2
MVSAALPPTATPAVAPAPPAAPAAAAWQDRNGTWFSYEYDALGRVVRTAGIDGILSGALAYDDASRTTTYTDSLGRSSYHRHNTEGLVVEETDPLGNITRRQWDERGDKPLAVTDPLGHTTRYTYDEAGNLTQVTLPDDATARATYNHLGLPTEFIEPGGAYWRHTYDERGNLLTTTDPLGAETHNDYDESGHLNTLTDALGHTRAFTVNAAGLPLTLTDELGHITTVRRDAFGRITETVDPLGNITRTSWTVEGKPERREHVDGTEELWTWDGEGNLLTHTDQAGHITQHTVAPFDVPATRTDPDGATYAFTYDTELRLTEVTNPHGLTWSYTYDPAGYLTAETDFNGRTLTYTRDATGALRSRTNGADETLRFTRDALGRVVEQRSDTGNVTTFAYGADGGLHRAINGDADVMLQRDVLGRVLSETVNGRTILHAYDALGRRVRRVTPSGLASEWTYDSAGLPLALRSPACSLDFVHDATGRETERLMGSDVALTQSWSAGGLLTAQSLTAPSAMSGTDHLLQHRTYSRRADGCLTEIRELTSGTRRIELDDMGRVTGIGAHGWAETYAYSTTGNVTRATAPAHKAPGEREFDGALLLSAGRTSYEHDAQGRLVRRTRRLLNGQRRTWTYAWDTEDRLVEVVAADGSRWRYAYDPLGRRISKHRVADDGATADHTEFTWDDLHLAEVTGPDGRATTWDYAPDSDRPVAQTQHQPSATPPNASYLAQLAAESDLVYTTRFHAIITDSVGTPTELVSAAGELEWQRRTSLWGTSFPAPQEDTSEVDCRLRFPGQYADTETGLHYNLHRYYDPETARYISPDPLGLVPAPDHYAYVHNPLSWSDPFGLAGKGPSGPRNPLDFGQGYTGRRDVFPVGSTGTDVEIHVYDKSMREVGLFNSQGWFNKHGISASEVEVPPAVENAIKGRMVYELRKVGRIAPKGAEDITGDKWRRPPLAAEGCK